MTDPGLCTTSGSQIKQQVLDYVFSKKLVRSALVFRGNGSRSDTNNVELHFEELCSITQSDSNPTRLCIRCATYGLEFFHLLEFPTKPPEHQERSMLLIDGLRDLSSSCEMCSLFRYQVITACSEEHGQDIPRPDHCQIRCVSYGEFDNAGFEYVGTPLIKSLNPRTPGLVAFTPWNNYNRVFRRLFDGAFYNFDNNYGLILPVRKSLEFDRTIPRARKLNPNSVDFKVIRSWVTDCQANHSICSSESSVKESLRVIDCHMKVIVPAPVDCQYVALSYVWGTSANNAGTFTFHSEHLPQLIRDSIKCTLEIGFRYLWCDRYCVPQEDEIQRHLQIRKMHEIYRDAWITIIAACSPDPTRGLSGFGGEARNPMASATVGEAEFALVRFDVQRYIENSKWASRGWTYQEGLLPTRRLVFTHDGIYFHCCCTNSNGGYCASEFLDAVLSTVGHVQDAMFRDTFIKLSKGVSIWAHIRRYTERTLSRDSDILNAFLGILGSIIGDNEEYDHLWGILVHKCKETYSECLASGLLWSATRPDLKRHYDTITRRKGFRSWSWVGSTGIVTGDSFLRLKNPELDISAETVDGKSLRLDDILRLSPTKRPKLGQGLYINAPMTQVYLRSQDAKAGTFFDQASFQCIDDKLLQLEIAIGCFNDSIEAHCLGIILGLEHVQLGNHLLLVYKVGNHFERITHLRLNRRDLLGSSVERKIHRYQASYADQSNEVPMEFSSSKTLTPRPPSRDLPSDSPEWREVFTISQHLRVENRTIYLR